MGKIIIAPHKEIPEGPLVYLGGPTATLVDWHSDAIGNLHLNDSISIASPRQARDLAIPQSAEEKKTFVLWEQYYSEYAFQRGVTLFWFPSESDQALGDNSLFQFGEAFARYYLQHTKLLVGIEPGFNGEEHLVAMIKAKAPEIVIAHTLSDLCEQALILISKQV